MDILNNYQPICDAITTLLAGHAEVVLHDLNTNQIAYISNPLSNRSIGDDSLVDAKEVAQIKSGVDVIGPYLKANWDGQSVKAITAVLRNEGGQPIGLLCINLVTGPMEAAINLLQELSQNTTQIDTNVLMRDDWRETTNILIRKVLRDRRTTIASLKRHDKIALLQELDRADIFQVRGSADYVARALSISRANLYQILKTARSQTLEGQSHGDDTHA